jgi:two-component system nitrogen regulation sensor histidine kinase NtrY
MGGMAQVRRLALSQVSSGSDARALRPANRPHPHYNRPMSFLGDPKRRSIALLGGGVLLVFAILDGLNAFNTSGVGFLNPVTSGETLAFTALTVLVFLLLMVLSMLLLRNILRLYASQSSSALGSRLRTRMVLGAIIIALTPAIFMFLFSFMILNRSIDRWFSPNTSELREDSTRVVLELAQYVTNNARVEAASIADSGATEKAPSDLQEALVAHRITLAGGFAVVYSKDLKVLARFQTPPESSQMSLVSWLPIKTDDGEHAAEVSLHGALSTNILSAAQRSDEAILKIGGEEYAVAMAVTPSSNIVVVGLPMPQGLSQTTVRIQKGAEEYWQLFRSRNRIRTTFVLLLLLITVFVFFSSVWLALFLSKQITRPVEALADAMDEIAAGKYDQRMWAHRHRRNGRPGPRVQSHGRRPGNQPAPWRRAPPRSSPPRTRLSKSAAASSRPSSRPFPPGVVTLDGAALCSNPTAPLPRSWAAATDLKTCAERDVENAAARRLRRRTGRRHPPRDIAWAPPPLRLNFPGGDAPSIWPLPAPASNWPTAAGTVLVIEDTTELLRAQRQFAWKEVAQRVAHEIKNPLTPIALSAERIARHLDRGHRFAQRDPQVQRGDPRLRGNAPHAGRSILGAGQFPAPQPRACDMNRWPRKRWRCLPAASKASPCNGILEPGLPPSLADPEAIRRALANLIDNAAEAMQGSLLRVLGHSQLAQRRWRGGRGCRLRHRSRPHRRDSRAALSALLFHQASRHRPRPLHRAKIVQEHGGSLRAEATAPRARAFSCACR